MTLQMSTRDQADARPILELIRVSHKYPGRDGSDPIDILRDVDLSLARGSLVCVAGRSGSGKTTFLSIAAGLLRPTGGEVRWDGQPIAGLGDSEIARRRRTFIGFVFQNAALIPSLTAAENVALPGLAGRSGTDGRARVAKLLDEVGLPTRHRHFPSQLSGGEAQRVAVARALYADPPLLVVDEPTANIDRKTADGVIELLAGLAHAGHGLLVASHDESLVSRSDAVIRLS
jgi:ABC-type lipoprotein export system ATPase subunit